MGKIKKAFAVIAAIIGAVFILCGLISILFDVLLNSRDNFDLQTMSRYRTYTFGVYLAYGCFLLIPGIIGIVIVFTKNFYLMVAFLVFNVIALLATIACLIYAIINLGGNRSYDYNCSNVLEKCRCITYNMEYTDFPLSCQYYYPNETILLAAVIDIGFAGLVALISSYITCCSLCHLDEQSLPVFVLQQPSVMSTNAGCHFGYPAQSQQTLRYFSEQQAYTPNECTQQQPYFFQQPVQSYSTHDKTMLLENQDI